MVAVHHHTTTVDGLEVFYREAGNPADPTIVLLHGTPSSSFMFRHLIPLLGKHFHVIAPDLIGFGYSSAPSVDNFDYTFDTLTAVTDHLLEQLGLDRYAIYTQDYGAPVGWRLALSHPDRITAIVTQNGNAYEEGFVDSFWAPLWTYANNRTPETAAPLREALELDAVRWQYVHGVSDSTLLSPDAWIHDHTLLTRPGIDEIQLRLFADYPTNVRLYPAVQRYFRDCRPPLLAVWGKNDEIFGPDGARAFLRDLPDAEIHLLDGGHFLLESHLDDVATLITTFLHRSSGARHAA
ncbi:alpha/beta hydrolase [Rhodococcus fascians]|uniref:alpha/beta fold hydrolase n=1 Tax=Nocardiaceae TaxID=85025 RepID=UPI000B9BCFFD|nr:MULTISPECIES: alpha/beta hydrolase [Rhodococcus]MDP9638097.1 pimeloyl-ACP methyl ester carboxylesterase [Rhodococcus cercidiphylli]MBJ7325628.1 alpha/beta hydrolase [Rhodococcus sp. (in: high G+C Gram-positive bacteria)]MBM7246243.1 alpha/beta hydrolase [Rhodococcus fascians]MBY3812054.1 alpha/beta hydrolase [Rhodococcus fascians]MBY3843545.1 alpha/beta hydrolase [Rhodococcus fascians]